MSSLSAEVIVIGDVHGCYTTLVALIDQIKSEFPKSEICFVGDLIDRGPRSREVVQFIIENGFKSVKGNHEQMMVTDIMNTTNYPGSWQMNGGKETLESYDGYPAQLLMHMTWMNNLPLFLEFPNAKNSDGRYLVVSHSAIGKVWDWSESKRKQSAKLFEQVILWDRDRYEDRPDIYNVFGHTPKVEPILRSFFANIDTGACFNRKPYGKLTALHYPSMKVLQQENIE